VFRRIIQSCFLAAIVFAAHGTLAAEVTPNSQAGSDPAPLTLSIGTSVISIAGASPSAQIYVIGLMRTGRRGYSQLTRYEAMLDAAQDGSATLVLQAPTASDALFFAVDLSTGAYGSVAPDGHAARELALPADALKRNNDGQLQKLETHLELADLLAVRPGVGAWTLTIGDGGPHDDDQTADGMSRNHPEQLQPIGASPAPPKNFKSGDLLAIFDPKSVAFLVLRVKE
jgi:hypothetical protein